MIIQVMSRKDGHAEYVVMTRKELQKTLPEIEELKPHHKPAHVLHVQFAGQKESQQMTPQELLNAEVERIQRILVRPVLMAG